LCTIPAEVIVLLQVLLVLEAISISTGELAIEILFMAPVNLGSYYACTTDYSDDLASLSFETPAQT
jgi:hypothetical protein